MRSLTGQVVGVRVQRAQRPEAQLETGSLELMNALTPAQVLEAVLTEVPQGVTIGHPTLYHLGRGRGHNDLTCMGRIHESSSPAEGGAEVVAVALVGFTGVDAHARPDLADLAPILDVESELQVRRRQHRVR